LSSLLRGITLRGEERAFYEAAGRGDLIYARCEDCGTPALHPRWLCSSCGSIRMTEQTSRRAGTVLSVTSIRRSSNSVLTAPYQVAIIKLEEGFTMMCRIVGEECAIDDRIIVAFENAEDGLAVPVARRGD
jgi:uncharacterized OB-fold protein